MEWVCVCVCLRFFQEKHNTKSLLGHTRDCTKPNRTKPRPGTVPFCHSAPVLTETAAQKWHATLVSRHPASQLSNSLPWGDPPVSIIHRKHHQSHTHMHTHTEALHCSNRKSLSWHTVWKADLYLHLVVEKRTKAFINFFYLTRFMYLQRRSTSKTGFINQNLQRLPSKFLVKVRKYYRKVVWTQVLILPLNRQDSWQGTVIRNNWKKHCALAWSQTNERLQTRGRIIK